MDLTDESGTGPVPTGLAFGPEARLHVAIFSRWPHPIGAGSVLRLDGSGKPLTVAADLTTPIDVTFDKSGRMYVLEFSSGFDQGTQPGFKPATGRVIRFDGAELQSGGRWPQLSRFVRLRTSGRSICFRKRRI